MPAVPTSVHDAAISDLLPSGSSTSNSIAPCRRIPPSTRNDSLAEYTAVKARNLAPLPVDIDHTVAAALPISGLTAWQGLFDHGRLTAGQTVLIHGVAGAVGSIAVQLAREVGARVISTGRTADRDQAGELGVHTFLDLDTEKLEDAGEVDVVLDVIGGDILARSAALVRAGGNARSALNNGWKWGGRSADKAVIAA